jgi:hypothetical protein
MQRGLQACAQGALVGPLVIIGGLNATYLPNHTPCLLSSRNPFYLGLILRLGPNSSFCPCLLPFILQEHHRAAGPVLVIK